jgi:hypothetical protein
VIQDRIRNILLTVSALLLFFNLVVTLAPSVHAAGKVQYMSLSLYHEKFGNVSAASEAARRAEWVQNILNSMGAQGWEYVGTTGQELIFKK